MLPVQFEQGLVDKGRIRTCGYEIQRGGRLVFKKSRQSGLHGRYRSGRPNRFSMGDGRQQQAGKNEKKCKNEQKEFYWWEKATCFERVE